MGKLKETMQTLVPVSVVQEGAFSIRKYEGQDLRRHGVPTDHYEAREVSGKVIGIKDVRHVDVSHAGIQLTLRTPNGKAIVEYPERFSPEDKIKLRMQAIRYSRFQQAYCDCFFGGGQQCAREYAMEILTGELAGTRTSSTHF